MVLNSNSQSSSKGCVLLNEAAFPSEFTNFSFKSTPWQKFSLRCEMKNAGWEFSASCLTQQKWKAERKELLSLTLAPASQLLSELAQLHHLGFLRNA